MDDKAGIYAAVAGTIGLFLCIQFGALALVEPFIEAEQQAVEDPEDPTNTFIFFGFILVATVVMLGVIKYGRERYLRVFVVLTSGGLAGYVAFILFGRAAAVGTGVGILDGALGTAVIVVPILAFLAVIGGLLYHPEWYVIDAAGVIMGAGAAGLFGASFSPFPAILFLSVLAVYDAISVYGTEHMLTLADGVMDLKIPVLLVIPTSRSYTFLDEDGPETLDSDDDTETDAERVQDSSMAHNSSEVSENGALSEDSASESPAGDDTHADRSPPEPAESGGNSGSVESPEPKRRDALFIGLGDAVMPTILVASAAVFHPEVAPIDIPGIALNLPALGGLLGTLVGLVVLLWLVLKGRAHAGLPLLNGGAIAGYLVGALLGGLTLVEAIGIPL